MSKQIKILLVDDHEVVRMGLRTLLERRENIAVVGEAGTVEEAVAAAERTEPDVIVMDIRLPDGSGVDACREIRGRRSGASRRASRCLTQVSPRRYSSACATWPRASRTSWPH